MLEIAPIYYNEGSQIAVIYDSDLGVGCKEIFEIPGICQSVCNAHNIDIFLCHMEGRLGQSVSINNYVLLASPRDTEPVGLNCNQDYARLFGMSQTALKGFTSGLPSEQADEIMKIMASVDYMLTITDESPCALPESALAYLTEEQKQRFLNSGVSNSTSPENNINKAQKDCASELSFVLPDLMNVHTQKLNRDSLVPLDKLVMLIAPYRTLNPSTGMQTYNSLLHTPYWKLSPNTFIEYEFPEINGSSRASTLEIQPNETPLMSKLYLFYCSDLSYCCDGMVSGIFLLTKAGLIVRKLFQVHPVSESHLAQQMQTILELVTSLKETLPSFISCSLSIDDVTNLPYQAYSSGEFTRLIRNSFSVTDPSGYLQMIQEHVDQNLPRRIEADEDDILSSLFTISGEMKEKVVAMLRDNNFISRAMYDYFVELCEAAYSINWGHNGVAKAIPYLVPDDKTLYDKYNKMVSDFLNNTGSLDTNLESMSLMLDDDDNNEPSGLLDIPYDRYVGRENRNRITQDGFVAGTVGINTNPNFIYESDRIVERYRMRKTSDMLESVIYRFYVTTNNVNVILEILIKLLRWGDRKPSAIVLPDYPEIKYQLDLTEGQLVHNSYVLDESDIILTDGCRYHLDSFLVSSTRIMAQDTPIVGFVIREDYTGDRSRKLIASWLDIAEMVKNNAIDIAELKVITNVTQYPRQNIETAILEHDFYISSESRRQALISSMKPSDMSPLALMSTNMVDSPEYSKAIANPHPITARDKQFMIMHKYVLALRRAYSEHTAEFSNISESTDITRLSLIVDSCHNPEAIVDHNTAVAGATLSKLNFNETSSDSIYVDTELNGKFILLDDSDFKSNIQPINFSDKTVASFVQRFQKRIVLLLLETPNNFILCRKDISAIEIRQKPTKTGGQTVYLIPASKFIAAASAIAHGSHKKLEGKPLVLHKSLEGISL